MRNFILQRDVDVSGISGTGAVAEGVEFSNGRVVVAWQGAIPSVVVWDNIDQVEKIHGHNGSTKIVWVDAP
ncbi:hypothetical protein [Aggregatilinea lenta]|uniref:hypothetical protein n=1 Tax=Aggregatilinea lenta TaxID=913108 RepID=UPI000E5B4665|nr:hypothetical protein [Aggregatilinea lenta]